jgi:capsular exopolysaccharide synthesis family protein
VALEGSAAEGQKPETAADKSFKSSSHSSAANGSRHTIANEMLASNGEESFLSLAYAVRSFVCQGEKRIILVTSSLRGEGKSFLTLNLAARLARISLPTLLIDADLRLPSQYHGLNSPSVKGLLTYLEGRADFDDCVHETSIPGLSIIPSGGTSRAPLEAFVSNRMNSFIAVIKERFRDHCVLVDSPPGLSAPEARLFKDFVDATLIVVAANRTPRGAVTKTITLLKDIPTLGLILNRYKPLRSMEYYGYYEPVSGDRRNT